MIIIRHYYSLTGGLAIYHDVESTHNDVIVQKLRCDSNTAINSGGCLDYVYKEYTYVSENTFTVEDMVSMSSNSALNVFGGAFSSHKMGKSSLQKQLKESCAKTFFKGKWMLTYILT